MERINHWMIYEEREINFGLVIYHIRHLALVGIKSTDENEGFLSLKTFNYGLLTCFPLMFYHPESSLAICHIGRVPFGGGNLQTARRGKHVLPPVE